VPAARESEPKPDPVDPNKTGSEADPVARTETQAEDHGRPDDAGAAPSSAAAPAQGGAPSSGDRVKASPLARRIAADKQTRHFDVVDQVRAIENQVAWVSTNQTGKWGPLRFLGGSKVVDPDGVVRARTGARAGLAVAPVDVEGQIADLRLHIDHLGDRRPETYGTGAAPAASGSALEAV
jgi:hypothetical protein